MPRVLERWALRRAARAGFRRKAEGSGEGSRGGHVIGHTKSGKPIYGLPHDAASRPHPGEFAKRVASKEAYSIQDHIDAAGAHIAAYRNAIPFSKNARWNNKMARQHMLMAAHAAAVPLKLPPSNRMPQNY